MIQWDPVQQEKIEGVAARFGISVQEAKDIVVYGLGKLIKRPRSFEPSVVVNVGVFYLDPRKTNEKILKMFKKFRRGELSEADLRAFLSEYLPLHSIAKTHSPLTGKRYRLQQMYDNNLITNGSSRNKAKKAKKEG